MSAAPLRLGCGAGFQGDRFEPAIVLAEQGDLDYLIFECLAERTIALAQRSRLQDPAAGYDAFLQRRMEPLLGILPRKRFRVITNMGAANPLAAGRALIELARRRGVDLKVAVVSGDDVHDRLAPGTRILETGAPLSSCRNVISANAYLGVEAILPALRSGADIILTGRVADPSLFLAPIVHHFNWPLNDWQRLGQGTVVGHLMECGGQVTGGYFCEPGRKDVPDPAHLGFPIAEVQADGTVVLSKVAGTGGSIDARTVKEQLLYEVTDPSAYLTPDVTADFTQVRLEDLGADRVRVSGGRGRERSPTFKVSVGYQAGYRGEGEISYAGENAVARAHLAARIVEERLRDDFPDLRIDHIGSASVHRTNFGHAAVPYEVRMRAAALAQTRVAAERIGEEVEALYTNGPAGGGGARKLVTEVIGIVSCLLPRTQVESDVTLLDTRAQHEAV